MRKYKKIIDPRFYGLLVSGKLVFWLLSYATNKLTVLPFAINIGQSGIFSYWQGQIYR